MPRTIPADTSFDPIPCIRSEIQRCFGKNAEIVSIEDALSNKHDPNLVLFTIRRLNYGWIQFQTIGVGYRYRHHFNRFLLALHEQGDLIEINDGWRFRIKLYEGRKS